MKKDKPQEKEEKPCEYCNGTGLDPQKEEKSCPKCNGTGKE